MPPRRAWETQISPRKQTSVDPRPSEPSTGNEKHGNKNPFRYLELPVELQLRIAQFALLGGLYTPKRPLLVNATTNPKCLEMPNNALLRTCKQVYQTTTKHCHERVALHAHLRPRKDWYLTRLVSSLSKFGPILQSLTMFHLIITTSSRGNGQDQNEAMMEIGRTISRALPNLRTIQVCTRLGPIPENQDVLACVKSRTRWFWNILLGLTLDLPAGVEVISPPDADRLGYVPSETIEALLAAMNSQRRGRRQYVESYLKQLDVPELKKMRSCAVEGGFATKTGGKFVGWVGQDISQILPAPLLEQKAPISSPRPSSKRNPTLDEKGFECDQPCEFTVGDTFLYLDSL
ncbi:hypothetical protein MBLNU230_g3389t1 [Neophaeotheca triangularis]